MTRGRPIDRTADYAGLPGRTLNDLYSPTYRIARDRFLQAASTLDARMEAYRIDGRGPDGEDLTVDVAILGNSASRRAVVVYSGLHGIEGYFGSAIQLAWLAAVEQHSGELSDQTAIALVHAINPFGFAWKRRSDEENIDLNRNFLRPGEAYAGAPPGYARLHGLLNPSSPPRRFDLFRLRAVWSIARHGMAALKNAIAVGQYEYPSGLFFGGRGPAASTRVVQENIPRWIDGARDTIHIDLHSGLGAFGEYRLLVPSGLAAPERDWYSRWFGAGAIEPVSDGIAYPARGILGAWVRDHLQDRSCRFLGAEFGTRSILRVLSALRAENRAHHYSKPGEPAYERTKRELMECFCPRSPAWRRRAIEQGLGIVRAAVRASGGQS